MPVSRSDPRVLRWCLTLVGLARPIVPAGWRRAWHQEWEAEIRFRIPLQTIGQQDDNGAAGQHPSAPVQVEIGKTIADARTAARYGARIDIAQHQTKETLVARQR